MEHIVDIKSKAFAVKIIKFTRFYKKRNMNLYFQSRYFALELALEPIHVSVKTHKAKQTLSTN